MSNSITYLRLSSEKHFEDCQLLQKIIWKTNDLDVIPKHFMIAFSEHAEQWGAFDNNSMIGIALAYPTSQSGSYIFHMLGILPEYSGKNIAYELGKHLCLALQKRKQNFITWTYDALNPAAANLYHNKIGAVGYKVAYNYYGTDQYSLCSHRLFCSLSLSDKQEKKDHVGTKELQIPPHFNKLRKTAPDKAAEISKKYFESIDSLLSKTYAVIGLKKTAGNNYLIFKKQAK